MTSDSALLATKKDIELLMEQMGSYYEKTERRIGQSEERMKQYFDVVAENIKHDFLHGAIPDKMEQHEDRIIRLEQSVGLAA